MVVTLNTIFYPLRDRKVYGADTCSRKLGIRGLVWDEWNQSAHKTLFKLQLFCVYLSKSQRMAYSDFFLTLIWFPFYLLLSTRLCIMGDGRSQALRI